MWRYPEKWGSCFQQALSLRPTVPHVLHVPEHVSSACPHSLGEFWDEVLYSWQPTGCKNSSVCSLGVGNHWDDSAWVVSVARVTFGRMLLYGAALPLLPPIFLYSRMASFREKVHHFNWIFSILRGVKINIFFSVYSRIRWNHPSVTSERSYMIMIWNENKVHLVRILVFSLQTLKEERDCRILIPTEAQESQGCELLH